VEEEGAIPFLVNRLLLVLVLLDDDVEEGCDGGDGDGDGDEDGDGE
jgi:hypothetical protein